MRTIIIFQIRKTYIIIGEAIDFDFEVEKNAFAGYFSCGAWVNGEYHIIDRTFLSGEGFDGFLRTATIRKVKIKQIIYFGKATFVICKSQMRREDATLLLLA